MTVRIVGLVIGLLFATRAIDQYRRVRLSRLELLGSVGLATAISVVSFWPAVTNFLADLFRLDNRLFALLVAATLVSFLIHLVFAARVHELEERMGELVRSLAVNEAAAERDAAAGRDEPRSEILVVIPAYEEAESIGPVLDSLPAEIAVLSLGAIVVVDASTDDTAFVASDRGRSYGIKFFAAMLRLFGRVDITDATNGLRAIRADALSQLELRENRFSAASSSWRSPARACG